MIKLSNGHSFEFMTASGALCYDGKGWPWEQPWRWFGLLDPTLFTSVTKSLTLKPRRGNLRWYNPFGCVRLIPDGVVNAVGLTNPGIDWWSEKIGPFVNSKKIPLVVSIFGEPYELGEMASILNDFDLVALEINASCPNTGTCFLEDVARVIKSCEEVRVYSRFPLILKLSVAHNITSNGVVEIVKKVSDYIEAFSINSVPWSIFSNQPSPLASLGGGGVSGKVVQPFTWGLAKKLIHLSNVPVIVPSIWDYEDIFTAIRFGGKAISFGSVFMHYPWRPTPFVRRKREEHIKRFWNN